MVSEIINTNNQCSVLVADSNLANYFNKGVNVPIIRKADNPKVGRVGAWNLDWVGRNQVR